MAVKTHPFHIVLLVVATLLFLGSCNRSEVVALERHDLFELAIGRMESELDLFHAPGSPLQAKTRIVMRDGMFAISNGSANKIMTFTSFGDLVSMVYNPDENPQPVLVQGTQQDGTVSNRRAVPYHFTQLGEIALSSSNTLLAEDRLPSERASYDEELQVSLNRIVLRFENDGTLRDYLGQEGIGGSPFPYIESLHTTERDEVVVISRTLETWLIFWFNAEGDPLYTVEIPMDRLPFPDDDGDYIPTLETIVPDRELPRLYLSLNYYYQPQDPETGTLHGMEIFASRVYWLDLETGRYEGYVDVPENVHNVVGSSIFEQEEVRHLYELVGVAPGEHFLLLSREDERRSQLLVMNSSGRVLGRRTIVVDDKGMFYRTFHVSPEGILTGLLANSDGASVVWWRSDRLMRSLIQ